MSGGLALFFGNVWQVQELKWRVFGCVAMKGVARADLGCVANARVSERMRRFGWTTEAGSGWELTFIKHDSMAI